MSQQPTPKQSFVQTALLVAVVFLGMRLMCPAPEPDARAANDIITNIRKLHAEFAKNPAAGASLVHTMGAEVQKLDHKLDQETPGDKLSSAQKDDLRYEALARNMDVQLKNGQLTKNYTQAQMAYQALSTQRVQLQKKGIWEKKYPTEPTADSPRREVSLSELSTDLRKTAESFATTAPVWGLFPGYPIIDFLVKATGAIPWFSYAFAALLLAAIVRGVVWPLAQKQYMWGRQMAQLQPLMKELKDKYTGQELNMKVMELYQQYGINPMAGCGPMLLQMPLFFFVYQCMLMYRFEFEKGTFLWISPAGANALPGIVAPNLGERDYILLVIYGASMIVTQMLTPVSDPANVRQQRMMGIGITILFTVIMFTPVFPVPAAFVLYWTFTNLIATFQMLRAYRMPLPPLVKVNTKEGGVIAKNPFLKPSTTDDPQPKTNGSFKGTGAPKLHKPKKKKK